MGPQQLRQPRGGVGAVARAAGRGEFGGGQYGQAVRSCDIGLGILEHQVKNT